MKESSSIPAEYIFTTRTRGWSVTEVLSNGSVTNAYSSRMAIDQWGNVHIVWYDADPSEFAYRCWNASLKSWKPVEQISFGLNGTSYAPALAVDGMGNIHVVWIDNTDYNGAGGDYDIFYARWNANTGNWTAITVVSDIPAGMSGHPAIAVDGWGNAHVVWDDYSTYNGSGSDLDIFYRMWNATTDIWTVTHVLSTNSIEMSLDPSVTVGLNGTVHVVWYEWNGTFFNSYYRSWNILIKLWNPTELISTEGQGNTFSPQIIADIQGNLHVVWNEDGSYGGSGSDEDIIYKRWNITTENWTRAEVISTESGWDSIEPALTTDSQGNVYVVWIETGPGVFYKYWNVTSGTWDPWELISTESTGVFAKPTIAVDPAGYVHIAWEDNSNYSGAGSDFDIFYKRIVDLLDAPILAPIQPNPDLDGNIFLNWTSVENTTLYYVYRDLVPFTTVGGRTPIGSTPQTNYTDPGLPSGTYYYAVGASNGTHDSALSNCESVLVQLPVLIRGWTTTELIFNESTRLSQTSKIVVDQAGNVHLTWGDSTDYNGSGTDSDIFYRLWNATTGSWAPVEVVSLEHPGTSYIPAIAVDAKDNVHIAWCDNTNYSGAGTDWDIFYKRWNATTRTWSPTVVVSNISDKASTFPAIVVDHNDNIHVVWYDLSDYDGSGLDSDIFYRMWNATTGIWTITQVLSSTSMDSSTDPSIAVDNNGTIHVVWMEYIISTICLVYTYWNATSQEWSNATLLSTESAADTWSPQIAVDKAGTAHVIWDELDRIYYKRRNATTGNWTTTELVSTETGGQQSALTTDHQGNVHVTWWDVSGYDGSGPDGDIFYKYRNATTGNWTRTEVISTESTGTSQKPTIAVDGQGIVHIAWEDATNYLGAGSDYDIFYKRTVWLPKGPVLAPIFPNPDFDGTIALNWSAVANTTTYYIYRDLVPFTAVGGRTPIGSTPQTNYTDPGLPSGTYYYAVAASNGTHQSALSNCESVLVQLPDTQPPQYTNAVEGRPSPQNYTANQVYQFNLTITDDVGLGTVFFEWNGTNATVSTHAGDEYYYTVSDLVAGTYQYRWVFNDTSDNWNATLLAPYTITKATPDLNLLLNGTPTNYQINGTWACDFTITLPLVDTVYLYLNESLMDSGAAPLENISQFNQLGVYNVTAWYPGGANYSAVKLTRWLTVVDGLPPGPCSINITIPYPPNFVLESSSFTLWGGTDVGSGISAYQYQIDTSGWVTGQNFSLAGGSNGLHTIAYRAVDAWGNNGTVQNCTVFLLANTADYDQDGLTNEAELDLYGTDLFNPDTDGDGILDGVEVAQGSDPLDANSPLFERVLLIGLIVGGVVGTGTILLLIRLRKHTPSSKAGGRKTSVAKGN